MFSCSSSVWKQNQIIKTFEGLTCLTGQFNQTRVGEFGTGSVVAGLGLCFAGLDGSAAEGREEEGPGLC